jgi:DNA helicase-2/ATP-dependent DNA helicase PcrA
VEEPFTYEPEEPALALPEELNEPQAEAVAHVDGPILIFAGAGSGKTRVIVYRIANLVAVHRVPPYRILAVTFTNKAAQEMRSRLTELIGADIAKDLWVGTFHATCVKLLRRYHDAAGLEKSFVIYDDSDQRSVMTRVIKELELDDRRYPPRQVLARIHAEKQEGRGAKDFVPDSYFDDAIGKCFAAYERHLKNANAVDFDDLLLAVLRIVEDPESPQGDEIRKRFRHVLVDEFQDVNQVQYRLVRAFAGRLGNASVGDRPTNLCVVGDDDQSIYRWRGADVRIVRGFRRDFPDARVVKLEQNYRSTGNVVKAALGVIKSAKDREPKELWTSNAPGEPITVVSADTEHDEAAFVAERIRALVNEGISPRQIAIFYRVHAQSRVLEEVLRAERIPYQIIGGMRFFERAEIKDALSYLRVVANPKSDVDLLRVINVPSRKLGDTTLEKLVRIADQNRMCLFDAIEPLAESGGVNAGARASLMRFYDLIQDLRREARITGPSAIAELTLEKSGYLKMLDDDEGAESDARKLNLKELIGSIVDYEDEIAASGEEQPSLAGYLERVTLQSDADTLEEVPKVAMMTVHAAKGLEFDSVFITGMEEDLFPFHSQDAKRNDDMEEERRLAYVAITRARRKLWVTHTARRMIFGTTRYGLPSRFLTDVPKDVTRPAATSAARGRLEFADRMQRSTATPVSQRSPWVHPQDSARSSERGSERVVDRNSERSSERGANMSFAFRGAEPARPASTRVPERPPMPERAPGERYVEVDSDVGGGDEMGFRRGSPVRHEKFGRGVIEAIDPGDDPIATVKFSGWGTKRIKARFLKL